jgi:hypothetical protein
MQLKIRDVTQRKTRAPGEQALCVDARGGARERTPVRRHAGMLGCLVVCLLSLPVLPVSADEREAERALAAIEQAIERARFDDAHRQARLLLARPELYARERNQALELLATAQIAARDELGARQTLALLFARDPEHPPRLRDPGPSVSAAFARARAERQRAMDVKLSATLARDAEERTFVLVGLGAGRDAVDSVHLFTRGVAQTEATHVVAPVNGRETVRLALPASSPRGEDVQLALEARAPSGVRIGVDGTLEAPLIAHLGVSHRCAAPARPARAGAWWIWTSAAIVIAGLSVSGAIVAH